MLPEELAGLLFIAFAVSAANWFRLARVRRKLEKRLWTLAAAHGVPVSAVTSDSDEVPLRSHNPRMDDLEGQVDQIAGQLDRLTESQEFLSRILADRIDRLQEPRIDTPH